jgi:hypothetical protein
MERQIHPIRLDFLIVFSLFFHKIVHRKRMTAHTLVLFYLFHCVHCALSLSLCHSTPSTALEIGILSSDRIASKPSSEIVSHMTEWDMHTSFMVLVEQVRQPVLAYLRSESIVQIYEMAIPVMSVRIVSHSITELCSISSR